MKVYIYLDNDYRMRPYVAENPAHNYLKRDYTLIEMDERDFEAYQFTMRVYQGWIDYLADLDGKVDGGLAFNGPSGKANPNKLPTIQDATQAESEGYGLWIEGCELWIGL